MRHLAKYLFPLLLFPTLVLAQDKVKIWDSGGQNLDITAGSAAKVDGSAVTQPMSAASLPLPTGASTEATLSTLNGKVTAVNTGAVTISAALPAGTNAIGKLSPNSGVDIGDVDVTSVPADPFGANADAASATGSISAKLRSIASTGIPITGTVTVGSHAVTNAGTFATQVSSVPADPFGVNADAASASGSISAKLRQIATNGIPITGTVTVGSHAVTNAGTFATQSAAAGDIAHDAADSGNPVKVGYKAISANPTAVTANDRANGISDLIGRQVVVPHAIPENTFTNCLAADITNTTSTAVKAAGSAGIRHYITALTVSNMDATVATRVDILDGSTVIWACPAAALGGGCTVSFPVPLRGTAATAINAQPAITSSETRVCVSGYDAAN